MTDKQSRLRWLWLAVPVIVLGGVTWMFLRPLPLPCPKRGQVVDTFSGAPIPGAVLTYWWRVYDYPMLDGDGSREIKASVTTDANGEFELAVPSDRPGFFNTDTCPPMVRADGYLPFTLSDWLDFVEYREGRVFIKMTPESHGD
jgi:hypothetical protein